MCTQVLRGSKAPKEVRRARAHALRELGGMFLDAAAARQEVAPPAQGDTQVINPRFAPWDKHMRAGRSSASM